MKKTLFGIISFTILLPLIFINTQVSADQWSSPTGQYSTDLNDRVDRIEHPSVDTFSLVDFLMCVTDVRADLYPNANYKAQVDEGACEALTGNVNPAEMISGKYAMVSNSCTRASNTAPQICHGWFETVDGDQYLARVVATTAPTSARPNGEFEMTFCKADTNGNCPTDANNLGRGKLSISVNSSDQTVFSLIDSYVDGGIEYEEKLYAIASDHTTKSMKGATVSYDYSGGGATQKTYQIDFDGTYALVKEEAEAEQCYPMSNYAEYPRQISLYSTTDGSVKSVGGGLQFEVATAVNATTGTRGYLNYWGAHLNVNNSGATPPYSIDGDTITAKAANSTLGISEGDTITINLADGVMRERKPFTGTLPDSDMRLAGESVPAYLSSSLTTYINGTKRNVYINNADKKLFLATAACYNDESDPDCDVTSQVTWNGAATISNDNFEVKSGRVGGWLRITNATTYEYTSRTDLRVGPSSTIVGGASHDYTSDLYLKCYGSDCRFPTKDGSTPSESGYNKTQFDLRTSMSGDDENDTHIAPNSASPVYYKLEADDMILYRCPKDTYDAASGICTGTTFYPVICDPAETGCLTTSYSSSYSDIWVGNLVKASEAGISDWDDLDSKTMWQWNASNHVRNEKGAFPKKADNTFINFEKPLEFAYTHTAADDRNGASPPSAKYTLVYEGEGELHGFDWVRQTDGDYYPSISLKDGTLVDINMDGTPDHAVLARQIKLVPTAYADTSNCVAAGLSVTQNGTSLPSLAAGEINGIITHSFSELSDGTYTFISDSPCVVDGEQQTVSGCQ